MYFLLIFLFILLGRLNSSLLSYDMLNTDEFVIGSKVIRLINSNLNIHEFDGDTSGILNALALSWPTLFNLDITYLSIRLTALIIISATIYISYKIICYYLEKKISLLLIVPLVLFFSLTKDPDFLHYTNELISVFFIVLAFYLFIKNLNKPNYFLLPMSMFLLGCVLFAKMQIFPVAIAFGTIVIFNIFFKKKDFKLFLLCSFSFILPSIFLILFHYNYGELKDLFYNVIYFPLSAKNEWSMINKILPPLDVKNPNFFQYSNLKKTFFLHLTLNPAFQIFYLYFLIFLFSLTRLKFSINFIKFLKIDLIIISILIFSSIATILVTGLVHRHYFIPLIFFVTIFLSIFLNHTSFEEEIRKIKFSKTIFVILLSLFTLSLSLDSDKFYAKKFKFIEFKKDKVFFSSPKILDFLKPDYNNDELLVWGWSPELYILSNLIPATREVVNQKQIGYVVTREYYRTRMIKDFIKTKPKIIFDYVKPKGYQFNNADDGIKSFNSLSKIISKDFIKLSKQNINCPDLYLEKLFAKNLNDKIIKYSFDTNLVYFNRLNDFNIDEEICESAVNFNKLNNSNIKINFLNTEKLNEVMILSSKKNVSETKIKIDFFQKNKLSETKNIVLQTYPHWTKINLKKNIEIDSVKIDVSKLAKDNFGLNEIKFYRKTK